MGGDPDDTRVSSTSILGMTAPACKSEAYAQCFGTHISFFSAPTGFALRAGIGEFICDECANLCGYADRSFPRSI
jgi:hypothetical protein